MITLITYPANFGEPSASPFCTKAIYLLNMSGVKWQREDSNDPRKWPKAKLPAITVDGRTIGGSDGLYTYLTEQGADLDKGLSDNDKSTSHALLRMAEEHMYFHIVLDRWGNDTVWPTVRDAYFHEIPKWPRLMITSGLRRALIKGMQAQGLGRLTPTERMARLEPDLNAISQRLANAPFLFGDTPNHADASVVAMLGAMRSTPVTTELTQRIGSDAILSAYVDRMPAAAG